MFDGRVAETHCAGKFAFTYRFTSFSLRFQSGRQLFGGSEWAAAANSKCDLPDIV